MRLFLLLFLSVFISISIFSDENTKEDDTVSLSVTVKKIKKIEGMLVFNLFNKSKGFPKSKNKYKTIKIKVTAKTMSITFKNLKKGKYAVTIHHDEDSNAKVNTNFIGIPNEGLGVSNNTSSFGPPSFEDAVFNLEKDLSIVIKVKY